MRISDWSSDVCSSDLALAFHVSGVILWFIGVDPVFAVEVILYGAFGYDLAIGYTLYYTTNFVFTGLEIGRASCRERVCQYVSIAVVAVSLKKKQRNITSESMNMYHQFNNK